jgi:hypothetical protein
LRGEERRGEERRGEDGTLHITFLEVLLSVLYGNVWAPVSFLSGKLCSFFDKN